MNNDITVWLPNKDQFDTMNMYLSVIAGKPAGINIVTYSNILDVFRLGLGKKYFERGDKLQVARGNSVLNFVFRHVNDYNAEIELANVFTSAQFDAPEFLLVTKVALEAGTYNITLDHGAYGSGTAEDATYQFTITQPIPAGGAIRHSSMGAWRSEGYSKDKITAGTFSTFSNAKTDTALESGLATTEGSSGTSLGTTTANNPSYLVENTTCYMNFTERQIYGSNRYGHSGLRQWLNSDKDGGTWWEQQNRFDRKPSNASSAGFMQGIDPEFLKIVINGDIETQLSVADGYGVETTRDRFYLASRMNLYMGKERDEVNDVVWDYYKDFSDHASASTAADTNRICYNTSGSPIYRWLRTPHAGDGYDVRLVSPDGSVGSYLAYDTLGVVPACKIGVIESDTTVAENTGAEV